MGSQGEQMKLIKKNVAIEIRTVIEDQGEKELTISKQKGSYIKKGHTEVITFMEKTKDFGEVKSLITIQPDKVNLKRSGNITMNQQFVEGEKSECLYRHPYGAFRMEIQTESITREIKRNDKKVIIVYQLELDDGHIRHHHLTLTYTEEK